MTFTGGAIGGGAGASSELFAKPATPHADDDEFEGTIDGSWVFSDQSQNVVSSTGAPTVYADVSAGSQFKVIHDPTDRPSWVVTQAEVGQLYMTKPITLATNTLLWTRLATRQYDGPSVNNDSHMGLVVTADASGVASTSDRILFQILEADTNQRVPEIAVIEGGSNNFTTEMLGADMDENDWYPYQYLAVHKVGTTYHFWIGSSSGNWLWVGSHVWAGAALARWGTITIALATDDKPGTPVGLCDFIRRIDTAEFYL